MTEPVMSTRLNLPNRRQGKVRDLYDATLNDGTPVLLLVASDRISAFDVVMPNGVPDKGVVLTQLSRFWFEMIEKQLGGQMEHHLIATDAEGVQGLSPAERALLRGRVMVGRRAEVFPIECVVRGYLAGSGWKEYQATQSVCGVKLPAGLRQCDRLPEPIFTPSTKAATGHDENISFDQACAIAGREVMETLRQRSLAIYTLARDFAAQRGILIADTKFEFGRPLDRPDAPPMLIDEVLTPDSSRFWPADQYQPGRDQPSFDKQYLRNYLQGLVDRGQWNKTAPGPVLPEEIITNTRQRYLEAYRTLTGQKLAV